MQQDMKIPVVLKSTTRASVPKIPLLNILKQNAVRHFPRIPYPAGAREGHALWREHLRAEPSDVPV